VVEAKTSTPRPVVFEVKVHVLYLRSH